MVTVPVDERSPASQHPTLARDVLGDSFVFHGAPPAPLPASLSRSIPASLPTDDEGLSDTATETDEEGDLADSFEALGMQYVQILSAH